MLTKNDLKEIGNLVDKKFGVKFAENKKKTDGKLKDIFRRELDPIKKNLKAIGGLIDDKMDAKFKKELTPIRKDVRKIQKDTKTIINYFDNQYLNQEKRITRIEGHLNLSSGNN